MVPRIFLWHWCNRFQIAGLLYPGIRPNALRLDDWVIRRFSLSLKISRNMGFRLSEKISIAATAVCTLLLTILSIVGQSAHAQAPVGIQWQKTIGSDYDDQASCVAITSDGGFAVGGWSSNSGAVYKLDAQGNVVWPGGTGLGHAQAIVKTDDGGVAVLGYIITTSTKEDISITKFDKDGLFRWQNSYGGTGSDFGFGITATSDGGFAVVGTTWSGDGNVTHNHGLSDVWVLKLNSAGALEWQQTYGGSVEDRGFSIAQTRDGGYVVAGATASRDGDVSGYHANLDAWVIKLTSNGTLQWQSTLGGSNDDAFTSIIQCSDSGYIAAGYTESNDGDVHGSHGTLTRDAWVVRLTAAGSIIWQRPYGGTLNESAAAIIETFDGGYLFAGAAVSKDGDVVGAHGSSADDWIVKITKAGAIAWQKCFGGSRFDEANAIAQTPEGGFIMAGISYSNDGDVPEGEAGINPGLYPDFWIVKLGPTRGVAYTSKAFATSICDSAEQTVMLHNTSTSTLILDSLQAGVPFSLGNNIFPAPIAAGDSLAIMLRFKPRSIGADSGILSIFSRIGNASFDTTLTFFGTAITGEPKLALSQPRVDYADTWLCTKKIDTLLIKNSGCDPLALSASVQDPSLGFQLRYKLGSISKLQEILPGAALDTLFVIFEPNAAGYVYTNLHFSTQNGDSDLLLTGHGLFSTAFLELEAPRFSSTICDSVEATLQVVNTSCSALILSSVSIDPPFRILNSGIPTTLESAEQTWVKVRYRPTIAASIVVPLNIHAMRGPIKSDTTIQLVADARECGTGAVHDQPKAPVAAQILIESISPNPTRSSVTLSLLMPRTYKQDAVLEVCDALGRILDSRKLQFNDRSTRQHVTLNLEGSAGVRFLRVVSGSGVSTARVVLDK
jgi:hypothetical protein